MYILYLDDSGSVKNSADKHIILAGVCIFERQPYWFSKQLDELTKELFPTDWSEVEFRGNAIFAGRNRWRGIERDRRNQAQGQALEFLGRSRLVRIFGAVIHKDAVSPSDPLEFAFEQLCNRFDKYLWGLHKGGNTQRGLIVMDESTYETSLQSLAVDFRSIGHRWGVMRNMSEVPLFVDSRATRMIQYADLVAYALRRYYEYGENKYIDIFSKRIHSEGGVIHGLIHYVPKAGDCNCLACRKKL